MSNVAASPETINYPLPGIQFDTWVVRYPLLYGSRADELLIYDLSDPAQPLEVDQTNLPAGSLLDLIHQDAHLFALHALAGLLCFDISAPSTPRLVAHVPSAGGERLAAAGQWIVVIGENQVTLHPADDLASGRTYQFAESIVSWGEVEEVFLLTLADGELLQIDPARPTGKQVQRLAVDLKPQSRIIQAWRGWLAIEEPKSGLLIIDRNDSTHQARITLPPGPVVGAAFFTPEILLALQNDQLIALDFSQADRPLFLWSMPLAESYTRLAIDTDRVFLGLESDALRMLRFPAWPQSHRLRATNEWIVENRSVGGSNSRMVADHVATRLNQSPAFTHATLNVGMNDALWGARKVELDDYKAYLNLIIDQLEAADVTVVLSETIPVIDEYLWNRHPYLPTTPTQIVRQYNEAMREVAHERSVAIAPVFDSFFPHVHEGADAWVINIANSGSANGNHPTEEGARQLAAILSKSFWWHESSQRLVMFGDSITETPGVDTTLSELLNNLEEPPDADASRMRDYLLGRFDSPAKLDINRDGEVDIADLTILVRAQPPTTPTLLSPANGTTGVKVTQPFEWRPGARSQTFAIYVWPIEQARPNEPTSQGLVRAIYNDFFPPVLDYDRIYQWQVAARNAHGQTWGPAGTFATESEPPLVDWLNPDQAGPWIPGWPVHINWKTNVLQAGTAVRFELVREGMEPVSLGHGWHPHGEDETTVWLPSGLTPGTGYRLRIVSAWLESQGAAEAGQKFDRAIEVQGGEHESDLDQRRPRAME